MSLLRRGRELVEDYHRQALQRYRDLSLLQKRLLWVWVALHVVMMAGIWWIGGMSVIFAYFASLADRVRALPYGWTILVAIIVVTSLPPLIGYGTAQTIVGFAYGVHPGFWISAASCLAGGAFAFVVLRRLLHIFAPYMQRNSTFEALSKAVRVKGLPLIIMIRLCPFPYPYSNFFFASIETVSLWEFLLATLHVFVGHRTYLYADPETRKSMDPASYWINLLLMVGGSALGFGTSWYLYRLTMRYVAEANGGAGEVALDTSDLEAGALLEDVDELLEEDARGKGRSSGGGESWRDSWSADEEERARTGDVGEQGEGQRDSLAWGLADEEERAEELIQLEQQKRAA
ncbi:Tlg2-vesicle protein [Rhodosporidiobolus nylandii]